MLLYTKKALRLNGSTVAAALQGLVVEEYVRLPYGAAEVEYRILLVASNGNVIMDSDKRQYFGGLRTAWGKGFAGPMVYNIGGSNATSANGLVGPSTNAMLSMSYVPVDATWLSLLNAGTGRSFNTLTLGALGKQHSGDAWQNWQWGLADWQAKFTAAVADQGSFPLRVNSSSTLDLGNWLQVVDPHSARSPQSAAEGLFEWIDSKGNETSPSASNVPTGSFMQSTVTVFAGSNGQVVAAGSAALATLDRAGTWVAINATFGSQGRQLVATASATIAALRTALTVADARVIKFSAKLSALSSNTLASLAVQVLGSSKWITVASTSTAGSMVSAKIATNPLIPQGSTAFAVQLMLKRRKSAAAGAGANALGMPMSATIEMLEFAPTPPNAPTLVSPRPQHHVTDVAVHYSWWGVEDCTLYDIEVCTTQDCAGGSVLHYHISETAAYINFHPGQNATGILGYTLLEQGAYWWRVRAVGASGVPGAWGTSSATFTVNSNRSKASVPIREVSSTSPMIHITCWLQEQPAAMKAFGEILPRDIANYTSIVFSDRDSNAMDLVTFMTPAFSMTSTAFNIAPKSGPGHPAAGRENIADIEWIFQRYPNVHGLRLGELMWSFWNSGGGSEAYHYALIQICKKYGRYFVWGDGDAQAWQWHKLFADRTWRATLVDASPYVVLEPKNNIFPGFWTAQSSLYGAFLNGLIGNLGVWDESWYWTAACYGGMNETTGQLGKCSGVLRDEPAIFRQLYFLQAVSQGATVYSIDGQSSTTAATNNIAASSVWYRNGTAREALARFVVPLFRGIINHGIIPNKTQVLKQVKLAISTPNQTACKDGDGICPSGGGSGSRFSYGDYGAYRNLYNGTYQFRSEDAVGGYGGQGRQLLHNVGGKYGTIPVLPYPSGSLVGGDGDDATPIPVLNLTDPRLASADKVRAVFDSMYSPFAYGDALVYAVGASSFVATSPFENYDVPTGYILNTSTPLFARGALSGIRGVAEVQSYVLGKLSDDGSSMWLQAQGRDENATSRFSVACSSTPTATADPASSAVLMVWNDSTQELDVVLSHARGAVEVTISVW